MKALFQAPDLSLSGQENKKRTRFRPQSTHNRVCEPVLEPALTIASEVVCFDRIGPAFTFDDPGAIQQRRDARSVQSSGHDENAQIRTQGPLCIERKCKSQVRIEGTFVKLVK